MRALLCSSLTAGTGNRVTAERLLTLIESAGYHAELVDSNYHDAESFAALVATSAVEIVVAVHAYRSGRLLSNLAGDCAFIVVLGGTDVNELMSSACTAQQAEDGSSPHVSVSRKLGMLKEVLQRCKAVVAFTAAMSEGYKSFLRSACLSAYPSPALIPQAVLPPPPMAPGEQGADLRQELGLPGDVPLLLLVAGLRPVKQPLYLLPALQACRAHPSLSTLTLCIVGPVLEQETAQQVAAATGAACLGSTNAEEGEQYGGKDGLYYHPPVPRAQLYHWLTQADACLNSSSSEGQSNTLLEAALAGCPRIARHVPGNASIIQHGVDGLLYSSVEEASACILAVVGEGQGRGERGRYRTTVAQHVADMAMQRVEREHSVQAESDAWRALLHRVSEGGC